MLGTFALQDNGDRRLLATVPFVSLIVCVLYVNELARVFRIGDYIHSELWPFLRKVTGYPSSWEQYAHSRARDWTPAAVARHIALDGGIPILLAALGAAALLYAHVPLTLLVVGWIAVAGTLALPLGFAANRRAIGLRRAAADQT